ncbi:MAG TPA: right-handed parallel beta-helix repeat-containing protein [Pyrinomonadaceae bacterium]
MNKLRFAFTALAFMAFTLAVSSSAQAQATRTWVSGVGDDVNPCSRTAPCKTYAGAISKTAKDGEISTLDPGGFGTITTTKSITINGGGAGQGYGSILSALAPQGVLVNITDVNDIRKSVKLNWLDINGASTGTDGIRMIAGNTLHIENTFIDGMAGDGVDINVSVGIAFSMKNVSIRNCVGSGVKMASTGGGSVGFSLNNVQVSKTGTGIDVQNGARGTITDTVIALNTTGISVTEAGNDAEANIVNATITGHVTGISVGAGARARIARCLITQNVTSLTPAAQVDTGNNNTIMGNTNNTAPAGLPFPQN